MLDYELKRMVNNDIEYCKKEWENYSFDWERMGQLFGKMMHKYINVIDGFDKDMKVISAYEKKNNSGDTYRDNLKLIISRLEAFRDNGYKNEGLLKENNSEFNIRPYCREDFDMVRLIIDRSEKINKKEKEEIWQTRIIRYSSRILTEEQCWGTSEGTARLRRQDSPALPA